MKSVGKSFLSRLNSRIAGTSAQLLTEYGYGSDLAAGRAQAAYCGFDVSRFAGESALMRQHLLDEMGWPEDSRIILFVGRLGGAEIESGGRSHKNPAFALSIAERCIVLDPRARLIFAGSGDTMQPILERRVHEKKIESHVRFLGLRSDVADLMLGSDALLFPSSAEGLGMVTVEAQAAGLPVLASDSTPHECVVVPELVQFLSLNSSPDAWASALLKIMSEPRISRSAANELVASSPFAIENSARNLLTLYGRSLAI
jgi:glycosyltransferase involved in cell wall biosynthesis